LPEGVNMTSGSVVMCPSSYPVEPAGRFTYPCEGRNPAFALPLASQVSVRMGDGVRSVSSPCRSGPFRAPAHDGGVP
jgi:hypothetical protein